MKKFTLEAVITYGALVLYGPLMMAAGEMESPAWRIVLLALSFLCLSRAAMALARARKMMNDAA